MARNERTDCDCDQESPTIVPCVPCEHFKLLQPLSLWPRARSRTRSRAGLSMRTAWTIESSPWRPRARRWNCAGKMMQANQSPASSSCAMVRQPTADACCSRQTPASTTRRCDHWVCTSRMAKPCDHSTQCRAIRAAAIFRYRPMACSGSTLPAMRVLPRPPSGMSRHGRRDSPASPARCW